MIATHINGPTTAAVELLYNNDDLWLNFDVPDCAYPKLSEVSDASAE